MNIHQRILSTLHEKLDELRLTLKVPKRVSLGLEMGVFTPKELAINCAELPTAGKKDLVILGMFISALLSSPLPSARAACACGQAGTLWKLSHSEL